MGWWRNIDPGREIVNPPSLGPASNQENYSGLQKSLSSFIPYPHPFGLPDMIGITQKVGHVVYSVLAGHHLFSFRCCLMVTFSKLVFETLCHFAPRPYPKLLASLIITTYLLPAAISVVPFQTIEAGCNSLLLPFISSF